MIVQFSNIVKNNLPLLVNTNCSYSEYVSLLTTSSKRFLNLSYRKYNTSVKTVLDNTITKDDLYFITDKGKSGLADLLLQNSKSEFKPHWFVKYYKNDKLISYNHISLTRANFTLGYCNCFFVFDERYFDRLFNTFSWFKFIEYIINAKLADVIDLVVDRDLYQYHKIVNGKSYQINEIQTSYDYLIGRDKQTGKFNDRNSSKFLFLTKQDKRREDKLISVVCKCGHKTLLNTTNTKNTCYSCGADLSILTCYE